MGVTCPEPPRQTVPGLPRNAAEVQDGSQYSVLLIITDGVISDMAQTKEAIVNVSLVGGPEPGVHPRGVPAHSRESVGPVSPPRPPWDHSRLLAAAPGGPGRGVGSSVPRDLPTRLLVTRGHPLQSPLAPSVSGAEASAWSGQVETVGAA